MTQLPVLIPNHSVIQSYEAILAKILLSLSFHGNIFSIDLMSASWWVDLGVITFLYGTG